MPNLTFPEAEALAAQSLVRCGTAAPAARGAPSAGLDVSAALVAEIRAL